MRVRVTRTMNGTPEGAGAVVHRYKAGKVYGPESTPPMTPGLTAVFLREGWAEPVKKAVAAAPENKMRTGADENKAGESEEAQAAAGEAPTVKDRVVQAAKEFDEPDERETVSTASG